MKPNPLFPAKPVLLALAILCGLPAMGLAQDAFDQAVKQYDQRRQAQALDEARQQAHEALKLADTPERKSQAMLLLAQAFDDDRQPAQALAMYEQAQSVQGLSPQGQAEALLAQASHHARHGNEAAARACYDQMVSIHDVPPSSLFTALRAKGYSCMQGHDRDLDAAREAFTAMGRIQGASELHKCESQYFLALIDRLEKKHDTAHQRLVKLVAREDLPRPVVAKYAMAMGDNHQSAGQYAQAMDVYRSLADESQASVRVRSRARLMMGISAIHLGNLQLARESFEQVIAMEDAPTRYADVARRRLDQITKE